MTKRGTGISCHPCTMRDFPKPLCPSASTSHGPEVFRLFGGLLGVTNDHDLRRGRGRGYPPSGLVDS